MQEVFEKIIEKLNSKKVYFQRFYECEGKSEHDADLNKSTQLAFDDAIEIVKQEAEKYKLYDTISIHTNGLEEGIRCAVCTNQIKSDTGCDGGCCVDENLVKRICDVIHKFECKPYQTNGE